MPSKFNLGHFHSAEKTAHLNSTVFAAWLESQDTQSLGHNHPLLPIVRRGNALEGLETLKSGCAAGSLVWGHAADGSVKDLRRGAVVERARLLRVDDMALVQEVVVAELI
jgi:hypothetical protein